MLAWVLGISAGMAQSGVSETQTKAELEALRARIQDVTARLEETRSEHREAEERIEVLDREIARLAGDLRRTEARQEETRQEIARLDRRSEDLRQRLAAQKERVADLAYSAYVMGRQSHVKLFLSQQDPAVINRMMGYQELVAGARRQTIERIDGWMAEVDALAREQAERRGELDALENEYRAEQDALEDRRLEREAALATLGERIASSEEELSRLRENEAHLEQVLRELQEYLAAQASRETLEGAFRDMKGKLRLPLSAPIAASYGDQRSTGVRWDGIMFRPDNGAEVQAIFEGRVVYADWLRGFGLLLIIDHGDGFMSLYSHNESLFKQLGDWVQTGEVISTAGTSGGLDRPGLYFEIRQDGEPQNPLSWCQRA